eukprot:gb/GECG01011634.1/.p1 GENE.gb/GECG01011634.1/~~gb/GECG01011634.1/.p1  ORF type:complete len:2040 (+),score=216.84 gb/GECG01011634.1/:1-6120(+)
MNKGCRHYGLYLWKNSIQKKRNLGSTCCEILAPILVVGFLVALNKNKEVSEDTFECGLQATHGAKYDFAYLPRALSYTNQVFGVVGKDNHREEFIKWLKTHYPGLNRTAAEQFNCTHFLFPKSPQDEPFVPPWDEKTNLQEFDTEAKLEEYVKDSDYGRKSQKPALFAAVVFHQFGDQDGNWSYKIRMNMTDTPDTHSFTDDLRRDLNVQPQRQYMSPDPWDSYSNQKNALKISMPGFAQIQMAVNKFIINDTQEKLPCMKDGSIDPGSSQYNEILNFAWAWECSRLLHRLIYDPFGDQLLHSACHDVSHGLLKATAYTPQTIGIAPFPISKFNENRVYQYTENTFAILFVISFLFPSFKLIRSIVDEKETKIREGMKMMGMSAFSLFSAWFTTYLIIFAIIAILICALTSWGVFGHTNGAILFLFFWLFGAASTALCFLISVFFSRAKVASVVGSVLFIATFFPYYAVNGKLMAFSSKSWASLLAPVAFGLNLDVLATTESNGVGITGDNLYRKYNNYTFGHGMGMLVLDFLLYTVLGWYLDQVVPSEFGIKRPWYFIFTPDYWYGRSHTVTTDSDMRTCKDVLLCRSREVTTAKERLLSGSDILTEDGDEDIDGSMFEPVGQHLKAIEDAGKVVRVKNLRKQFPTPDGTKVAVENLDLTMYEGQIFALLGHNGAGKSTAISMLSGLIAPSSGGATIYGYSIESDLSEIRKQMGICPQHDVLWPDVTVKEHLQYFAGIKGVAPKEVEKTVNDTISEVGLREKVNTVSAELSGGQKRKLSVGIALIGGSKVVFLDEPTSGMDPYSRRSTWNILQNARQGRIMILTTHFMDEADLLGDRIAIMADGLVQCCGSSMFLKQQYGVGYNLTLVKDVGCNPAMVKKTIAKYIDHNEFEVLSDVGTEIAFQLPMGASAKFPSMLKEFEDNRRELKIYNFGIGVTTLEEVFLRVAEQGAAKAATKRDQEDDKVPDDNGSVNGVANVLTSLGKSLGNLTKERTSGSSGSVSVKMQDLSGNRSARGSSFGGDEWVDTYKRPEEGFDQSMFFTHFKTLFRKRWNVAKRDKRALVFQLFIPVLALLAGLLLLKLNPAHNPPEILLSPTKFNPDIPRGDSGDSSTFQVFLRGEATRGSKKPSRKGAFNLMAANNTKPVCNLKRWLNQTQEGSLDIVTNLTKYAGRNYVKDFSADFNKINKSGDSRELFNDVDGNSKSSMSSALACFVPRENFGSTPSTLSLLITPESDPLTLLNESFKLSHYLLDQVGTSAASRYGAFLVPEWSKVNAHKFSENTTAVILVNSTALHGIPTFLNVFSSLLFRQLYQDDSRNITIFNSPFPFTNAQHGQIKSITSFITVLFIVIAFAFIPSSFAVFIVKEREVNAKHQQLISGVSIPAYWASTYVWDMVNYIPPLVASIILILAFDVTELIDGGAIGATILLFVFYGLAVAAFTYCLSYLFKSHSTAQTVILVANLSCLVLLLASFIMHQIPSTCKADRALRFVYRLIPGYSLGNGLLRLSIMKGLIYSENDCGELSLEEQFSQSFHPFSMSVAGWPLLYMALEAIFYFLLAVMIDVFLSYPSLRQVVEKDKDVEDKLIEEDEDVLAEAERVQKGDADGESIVVRNLRKVYGGRKVAIRNLSFGIPEGNVFGFLGINGAGKTTTLKILSGDLLPTKGTAQLGGKDVLTQQIECRRMLGYCPQFDALFELLTVREHLELFAKIKGVPDNMLESVVQGKMREMGVKQFEHRCAGTLSGGNKRKLSVALAMIGDPSIVFLDEPSTGMDPMARRFMWDVIERIATKNKRCSIILTTHSMEECEALCTNVGIMVGGRLRCLGSVQHLKSRFGKGYLLEAKLRSPSDEWIRDVHTEVERFCAGDENPDEEKHLAITVRNLSVLCEFLGDKDRHRMIHPEGSGWSLATQLNTQAALDVDDFCEWWAVETVAARFNAFVLENFEGAYLVERHGDLLRYKLPELSVPLSKIFGMIEAKKSKLNVATYSLSQTTLEQIFNIFASQQEEETGAVRGMAREPESSGSAAGDKSQDASSYKKLED